MKRILFAALLLAAAHALHADCAPHRILKIVMVAEVPDQAAAPEPRTMYRLGNRYARIEEPVNKADNSHLLIIVNEPDLWVVNRTINQGQHLIDPGPTYEFHALILDSIDSKFWSQLEFGCEEPFMKAVGARVEKMPDGVTKYTHAAEGTTVTLLVRDGKPQRVDIVNKDMQYGIRYAEYSMSDSTSTELFRKPENVTFTRSPDP